MQSGVKINLDDFGFHTLMRLINFATKAISKDNAEETPVRKLSELGSGKF